VIHPNTHSSFKIVFFYTKPCICLLNTIVKWD